jgi:ribose transport system permease protein
MKIKNLQRLVIFFAVIAVFIIMIFLKRDIFLSVYNMKSIVRELSFIGIISCGVCLLMIMGQFDLSVGAVLTMAAVLAATFVEANLMILAWTVPLLFGLAVGFLNGFLVGKLKAHSFLITLGTTYLVQGAVLSFTGGNAITNLSKDFVRVGRGEILFIPIPTLVFVGVAIVSGIILTRTAFGKKLFALGGNEKAAIAAGINVDQIKIYGFLITGFLSALSGILYASRLASASPLAGTGFDLDSIAAVVLGGTNLFGGSGTIPGTVLGVVLVALIVNGINLMQVQPYLVFIVKGVIVAAAVALNIWFSQAKVGKVKNG